MYNIQGNRQGLSGDTEVLKTVDMRYPQHELDKENKLKIAQAKAKGGEDKKLADAMMKGAGLFNVKEAKFTGSEAVNSELQRMHKDYTEAQSELSRRGQLNTQSQVFLNNKLKADAEALNNYTMGANTADENLNKTIQQVSGDPNTDRDQLAWDVQNISTQLGEKAKDDIKHKRFTFDPTMHQTVSQGLLASAKADPNSKSNLLSAATKLGYDLERTASLNQVGGVNSKETKEVIAGNVTKLKQESYNNPNYSLWYAKEFRDANGLRGDKFIPNQYLITTADGLKEQLGFRKNAKGVLEAQNPSQQKQFDEINSIRTKFEKEKNESVDKLIESTLGTETKRYMTIDLDKSSGSGMTYNYNVKGGVIQKQVPEQDLDKDNLYLKTGDKYETPFTTSISVTAKKGGTPQTVTSDVPDVVFVNGQKASTSAMNRYADTFGLGITSKDKKNLNKFVGSDNIVSKFTNAGLDAPSSKSGNWTWVDMNEWVKSLPKDKKAKHVKFLIDNFDISGIERGTAKLNQSETTGQKTQGFASRAQMEQAQKQGKATPIEVQQSQSKTQSDPDVPYSAVYKKEQLYKIIDGYKSLDSGMQGTDAYKGIVKEHEAYRQLERMARNSNTTPAGNTKPKEQVKPQPQNKSWVQSFSNNAKSYLEGDQPKGQGKNKGGK